MLKGNPNSALGEMESQFRPWRSHAVASVRGASRPGEWTPDPGFGVYVHIPFCAHRCHYCDFNTYEGQEHLHEAYAAALVRHIETYAPGAEWPRATSVFFGGGTPTLLAPRALARILRAVADRVGIDGDAEITVEANPETVDEQVFEDLLEAGFNRVSIGVQSLAPHVLRGLGRTHSSQRALDALAAAHNAGFDDVNGDLIYGSPWEKPGDWTRSLAGLIEAEPEHVSAYALTIEEGTPLATLVRTGRVPDVDPDVQADRHALADEMLSAAGHHRYEISNWARPANASRHNVLYWSAGNYLGFGAGAHGHLGGRRHWSVRLPREFIARVNEGISPEAGAETLTRPERAGEALMLGLRLTSGIELEAFSYKFGKACLEERAASIGSLLTAGLLEKTNNRLRMTKAATLLANEVAMRLL